MEEIFKSSAKIIRLCCFILLGFQQNYYIVGFLSKPQSEGTTEEKCAVHRQTIILFCTQCKQLLCTTCLVKQHNGHKVKVTDVCKSRMRTSPLTASIKIKQKLLVVIRLAVNDLLRRNSLVLSWYSF